MEVTSLHPRTPFSPRFRTAAGDLSMQDSDSDDDGSEYSKRTTQRGITKHCTAGVNLVISDHTALDSDTAIAGTGAAAVIEGPELELTAGPYANVTGVDNSTLTCTFGSQSARAERELGLILDLDPEDSDFLPLEDPGRGGKRPCYDLDFESRSNLTCHCRLKHNMTLSVVHHDHHDHHSDPGHPRPATRPSSLLLTGSSSSSSPNRASTSRGRRTHTHNTHHSARCSHSVNNSPNVNEPIRNPLGLLDLPNEIVLSILEDLPSDDLYCFSFASRKFHELSLGCYLARYGVGPLRRHRLMLFDEVHAEGAVKAMKAALFRPVLNSVYYSLGWGGKGAAGGKVQCEMRTLCALLDKACSVREVVVNVDRVNGGAVGDADEGFFAQEFTHVLDCALRKGCQYLSVYHSGTYTPDVEVVEDTVTRSFSGIRGLVKKYTPSTWAPPSLSWISTTRNNTPQQPTLGSLTHFGLHSPILFHPQICSWTIDTLNASSSLTTLTINHQLAAPPRIWSVVLPHISIPRLSRLSINLMALASEDLFRFLKRHESIERLDIGRSMGPPNPFVPFPKGALKNVRHLSGPPKWLAHVLLQPGSLPVLKRVTIVWRERGVPQRLCASFMGVHVVLMPVMERLKSMEEIGLEMSFGSVSTDWIPSGRLGRRYEYDAEGMGYGATRGHIDMGGAGSVLSSISGTQGATAAAQSSIENIQSTPTSIIYTHTTHLEIEMKSYSIPFGIMTQRFGRWLEEFERLRWLGLRTLASSESVPDSEGEGGAPFASVLQKDIFMDSVKTACPKIEVVELGVIEEGGVY